MDYTTNELDCIIRELEAVKNREKDPGSKICLIIAQSIIEQKMKEQIRKEALKGVRKNGK